MRLRDYQRILKNNVPRLSTSKEPVTGQPHLLTYKGLHGTLDALNELEQIPPLREEIHGLRTSTAAEILVSVHDTITSIENLLNPFVQQVGQIRGKANLTLHILDSILDDEEEGTVYVKLPPLNTLGELSSFTKELNSVLSQTVLLSQVKGRAEIKSFDHGSLWIEILVGAPLAVTFLSRVVESSLKLRSLKLDGDRRKIELEMMQLKKESIEDYVAKQKGLTDKLVEEEASSLAGMLNPKLDGEQMNGLRESIRMIDKLIQKGTEIYPSLPDTQKQELPSFDYKKLIEPKIKALTDGTDENDPADEG